MDDPTRLVGLALIALSAWLLRAGAAAPVEAVPAKQEKDVPDLDRLKKRYRALELEVSGLITDARKVGDTGREEDLILVQNEICDARSELEEHDAGRNGD